MILQSTGLPDLMFPKLSTTAHLLSSYRLARLDNRYKRQTCKFDFFLEGNLGKLQWELQNNRYYPSPYNYFIVSEPKVRHVAAPKFIDRVFHHALVSLIEPVFERTFISDAYACRRGKGTHYGMKRMKKFLQAARSYHGKETPIYILQCDISKFFSSISWDILLAQIAKNITEPKMYSIITKIVTMHQAYQRDGRLCPLPPEVISIADRRGLPIGNLTSQLFANVYLNPLDHFVKETLKERWYGRYMDDFFIIHSDIDHLLHVRSIIRSYLANDLHLILHPRKSSINNVKNGVAFLGYRVFYDHVLIRGNTLQRYQRKLYRKRKLVATGKATKEELEWMERSFDGHLRYARTYHLKSTLQTSTEMVNLK